MCNYVILELELLSFWPRNSPTEKFNSSIHSLFDWTLKHLLVGSGRKIVNFYKFFSGVKGKYIPAKHHKHAFTALFSRRYQKGLHSTQQKLAWAFKSSNFSYSDFLKSCINYQIYQDNEISKFTLIIVKLYISHYHVRHICHALHSIYFKLYLTKCQKDSDIGYVDIQLCR